MNNYDVMLSLEKRINDGEWLSHIENKMLIELQKYFYGDGMKDSNTDDKTNG